jgi:hypothetical protein
VSICAVNGAADARTRVLASSHGQNDRKLQSPLKTNENHVTETSSHIFQLCLSELAPVCIGFEGQEAESGSSRIQSIL